MRASGGEPRTGDAAAISTRMPSPQWSEVDVDPLHPDRAHHPEHLVDEETEVVEAVDREAGQRSERDGGRACHAGMLRRAGH